MRITLIGSMSCADKFVETYYKLKEMGHEPLMYDHIFGIADGSAKDLIKGIAENHAEVKRKHNFIKRWHDLIKTGDAVLVLNFEKNGIKNYVGGNTLMEMGFAHVNDKKIFLFNPIPEGVPYRDEIEAMADVVLNGDLSRIE